MDAPTKLKDSTFWEISRLIYSQVGIVLGEQKKALVSARIGKRMRQLQMSCYDQYLEFVKKDQSGTELIELINAISTNVTHFFREDKHFTVMHKKLQQWEKEGQKRFRIWCAAASTGQEPYTLAITACEALSDVSNTRLLATDIDTQALQKASAGIYPHKLLDKVPPPLLKKYFTKLPGQTDQFQVQTKLKNMIKFGRINLSKPPFPLKGPLDIIFCRNVMIYFDNEVRRKLLEEATRLLKRGGILCVGQSESLSGMLCDLKPLEPAVYIKE